MYWYANDISNKQAVKWTNFYQVLTGYFLTLFNNCVALKKNLIKNIKKLLYIYNEIKLSRTLNKEAFMGSHYMYF